ncbi:MAG: ribosomal RNA small subunit methyltransferase A [Chloroflexi bacterium]|nr:ribosomal RNA small subunit methyltransferase A [Chloroflexota bacterium]
MSNPKSLLESLSILPKKSLGQNFLHDPNALDKIVQSAELPADAVVLEIGPGTGALTTRLAQAARRVVAFETDVRLHPVLEALKQQHPNVEVVWGDFLEVNLAGFVGDTPYYVVANLPYYITSAILRKLLEHPNHPKRMVVTVQREVADRITAKSGEMSLLSVSVQFYGKPELVMRLNPAVFWPRPDVESAVVRIDTYPQPPVDVPDDNTFFKVVRAGFGQKRKQLKNSLANGLALTSEQADQILATAGIDGRRRAETMNLEEWAILARSYTNLPKNLKIND